MPMHAQFLSAIPVLASMDIERSVDFFCSRLGFTKVLAEPGVCGIVASGPVQIHFWACTDRHLAENTSCRVSVKGIDGLFSSCLGSGIVHPNAPLKRTPWGTREFGILDLDGNLVTFCETGDA
jgi:hypothetical protein